MEVLRMDLTLSYLDRRRMIQKYHLSSEAEGVYEEIKKEVLQSLKAVAYIEEDEANESFQIVATLGEELDTLQAYYCDKEMLTEAYLVDCFGMYLLEMLYERLRQYLGEKINKKLAVQFPQGETAWEEASNMVEKMSQCTIRVLEGCSLSPRKSVAFYVKEAQERNCGSILCSQCDNVQCPNREVSNMTYGYQRIFGNRSI